MQEAGPGQGWSFLSFWRQAVLGLGGTVSKGRGRFGVWEVG
jgi:hypothetical protein